MKSLDKEHVKHVAKLARLRLDENEVSKYEIEIGVGLHY